MISTCRNVLKGLHKLSSGTEDILGFLDNTYYICRYDDIDKTYDYSKYKSEINSIIKQLISDGYLEYSFNEYHFALTQKGLHPYRFQWDAFKSFLIKSILVPIGVSFITAMLTLLVKGLL